MRERERERVHKRVCAVYTKRESPFLSPFKKNKKKRYKPYVEILFRVLFLSFLSLRLVSRVCVVVVQKLSLSPERKEEEEDKDKDKERRRLFFLFVVVAAALFVLCVFALLSSRVSSQSSLSLSLSESRLVLSERRRGEIERQDTHAYRRRPERERELLPEREREREMMRAKLVLDVRGCSSSFSSSSRCGDDDDDDNKRKKKKTMRYARVTKRTPPKRDLGLVRVDDEQLTCGAKLDLDDDTFVISRVTKTYTLVRGKYVEDEKRRVEVESLERSLLNRQLSDVFKRS